MIGRANRPHISDEGSRRSDKTPGVIGEHVRPSRQHLLCPHGPRAGPVQHPVGARPPVHPASRRVRESVQPHLSCHSSRPFVESPLNGALRRPLLSAGNRVATMAACLVRRKTTVRTAEGLICGGAQHPAPSACATARPATGMLGACGDEPSIPARRPRSGTAKRAVNNAIGGGSPARHDERVRTGPASIWWRRDQDLFDTKGIARRLIQAAAVM